MSSNEENSEKTNSVFMSSEQGAGQYHNINMMGDRKVT